MATREGVDLSLKLSTEEEAKRLAAGGDRLQHLRLQIAGLLPWPDGERRQGPPVCLVFEGWDASGKGGAIKRLVAPLDPRHVHYAAYSAPTEEQKREHYLFRFVPSMPKRGSLSVIDRSWYGRVLVERVEGFATEEQWRRAYGEINGFERLLAIDGTIFLKFWLEISDAEQLHRFERRRDDPLKSYKLTEEDWRNRDKRQAYEAAVDEMLERTDTDWAPWVVVPAENKRYARVFVMEQTIAHLERALGEA
jgi:polyphosphate kinase 2 (PPK2 family)